MNWVNVLLIVCRDWSSTKYLLQNKFFIGYWTYRNSQTNLNPWCRALCFSFLTLFDEYSMNLEMSNDCFPSKMKIANKMSDTRRIWIFHFVLAENHYILPMQNNNKMAVVRCSDILQLSLLLCDNCMENYN